MAINFDGIDVKSIDYWDCDPGKEHLSHRCVHDAIEYHLDDWAFGETAENFKASLPESLTVYGWKRIKLEPKNCWEPLEDVLERLDETYGNPEGDGSKITDKMKEAQHEFLKAVLQEYDCWACDQVVQVEVNPLAWVKEHRPGWLED